MEMSLILSLGWALSAVLGLFCLIYKQKSAAAVAELAQGQKALQDLKTKLAEEKNKEADFEQRLASQHKLSIKLEKDLRSAQNALQEVKKESESRLAQQTEQVESLSNQLDHYKSQATLLSEQVSEMMAERSRYKQSLTEQFEEKARALKENEKALKKEFEGLHRQFEQKQRQIKETQDKLSALEAKTNEAKPTNPFELREVKQKIRQYQTFYTIARGQKEMAEERNENWELALRLLASWILKEKAETKVEDASLGALVAKALEFTRSGTLVTDGEDELSSRALAQEKRGIKEHQNGAAPAHGG